MFPGLVYSVMYGYGWALLKYVFLLALSETITACLSFLNDSLFNRNIRLFFFSGKYAFATVFEKHIEIFCRMPLRCLRIYVSGMRRIPVVRILL